MKGGIGEGDREELIKLRFSTDQINNLLTNYTFLPISLFRNSINENHASPTEIMTQLNQPEEDINAVVPMAADENPPPINSPPINRTGGKNTFRKGITKYTFRKGITKSSKKRKSYKKRKSFKKRKSSKRG